MYFKKLEILFIFISCALLVFSSPVKIEKEKINKKNLKIIKPTEKIQKITDGLSIFEAREKYNLFDVVKLCEYNINDSCVDKILNATGISSSHYTVKANGMNGSTFSVPKKGGNGYYVGRNIDLNKKNQNLILVNYPEEHYSSISTVNPDFFKKLGKKNGQLSDDILMITPYFATLDGLNEKGVSISVNKNQGDVIKTEKNETKLNLNVSFLIRLILDYAASTDKAIDILRGIELHNDFDFNVHFMISDANGKSIVVEYNKKKGNSKMIVTESSIVTNFNIASGKKSDSGKKQYNIIKKMKRTTPKMSVEDVMKTLKAAKHNTQCSIIYDLNNREAIYYVRENYKKGFKVQFNKNRDDTFPVVPEDEDDFEIVDVNVTKNIQKMEKSDFKVYEYEGDYGFDDFMKNGGSKSERDIFEFVFKRHGLDFPLNNTESKFPIDGDACSAFTVKNEKGDGYFFGRNYDFPSGKAISIVTRPKDGYASISTVDINVIKNLSTGIDLETIVGSILTNEYGPTNYTIPEEILKEVLVYTPFDGINEKGLTITLNMVPIESTFKEIDQNDKNKVDLSMTALIRYLLDTADTVDNAIKKIKSINMHNHFVHFLISDASGKTVAIEFKKDSKKGIKMFVVETPVVTNYYLADDEDLKSSNYEILNDDRRYDSIVDRLSKKPKQSLKDVRNTLRAGNQDITIWSAAFDKTKMEATYFIENDFSIGYRIKL